MKKIILLLVLAVLSFSCEQERLLQDDSNFESEETRESQEFNIDNYPVTIALEKGFLETTYDLNEHDLEHLMSSFTEELYNTDLSSKSENYYIGYEFSIDGSSGLLTLKPFSDEKTVQK